MASWSFNASEGWHQSSASQSRASVTSCMQNKAESTILHTWSIDLNSIEMLWQDLILNFEMLESKFQPDYRNSAEYCEKLTSSYRKCQLLSSEISFPHEQYCISIVYSVTLPFSLQLIKSFKQYCFVFSLAYLVWTKTRNNSLKYATTVFNKLGKHLPFYNQEMHCTLWLFLVVFFK